MAITVTKPVDAPTNLSAALVAGGSLASNTTYYYIVIAYDMQFTTCGAYSGREPHFSDISAEDSFTTTTTDLSVTITWDNASGATHYNLLLSTTSGDYTASGGYGGVVNENIGTITDGPTGITITELAAVNSNTPVFHSVQLTNPMHPQISNDLGLLHCEFVSGGTYRLENLYDAIVAAGYSDYVYYDGFNFALKGWIYANEASSGLFYAWNKRITMLKGGIRNLSPEGGYVFKFGQYYSDLVKGSPYYGCSIELQGARYTLLGNYPGALQIYDSLISFSDSAPATNEPMYSGYFNGGFGSYMTRDLSTVTDCIVVGSMRGNSSDVYDLKMAQGNNFGNDNYIRCRIFAMGNMQYSPGYGAFYSCAFLTFGGYFSIYTFVGYTLNYTDMYDCEFPGYPDNMCKPPYVRWYVNNNDPPTSPNFIRNSYSVTFTVLDVDGNPVEGVSVSAIDGEGNSATWAEKDGGEDGFVTGNQYTSSRTTDADGKVDYYLPAYKTYLDPDNTENIAGYSNEGMLDEYYPYMITFSKNDYRSYSILLETLTEPAVGIVTLETGTRDYKELLLTADMEEDKIYAKV